MTWRNVTAGIAVLGSLLVPDVVGATPVRSIPNLVSITFFERSGGDAPTPFTFLVNSSQLTNRLATLNSTNQDFAGVATEFYDVFYSNADGQFNLNGEYLTIEGVFGKTLAADGAGGGLNLAEIRLNFSGTATEFGNFVASSLPLGDNAIPASVGNAIDGDLLTHTTMGNTVGTPQRLLVTLGFLSSSGPPPVPEPSALVLLAAGALALIPVVRRRR